MTPTNRSLIPILVLLLSFTGSLTLAQGQTTREITLDDIYRTQKFTAETLEGLRSMNDGEHYTVQTSTGINKYSFKTGDYVKTLFDMNRVDPSSFPEGTPSFDAYQLSSNEEKILIETEHEPIYRHSYRAIYYVWDMNLGLLSRLSDEGKQQLATFSPSGTHVAFVRDNNLYIRDLGKPEEDQITTDGVKNEVINGAPDWVYEEEFGFSKGFCWSPDSKKIAFYRFDERRVKQFHMTMFGPLYPESYQFKYPKAGEENAVVSIHVYDLESGKTRTMDIGDETDQYIPRIKWTTDPNTLSIMRLNRLQNRLDIIHADACHWGIGGGVPGREPVVYLRGIRQYSHLPGGR